MARLTTDQDRDLRELKRLVRLYPEQAWLTVAGESDRRTVDEVRDYAARGYRGVDWAVVLEQAPREELLKVIGVVTSERNGWRDRGREQAEAAGAPAVTGYVRTIRIVQADLLLDRADALDEQIAETLGRLDLLGWEADAADGLDDGLEADPEPPASL